jgi:hypothetical protein
LSSNIALFNLYGEVTEFCTKELNISTELAHASNISTQLFQSSYQIQPTHIIGILSSRIFLKVSTVFKDCNLIFCQLNHHHISDQSGFTIFSL